MSARPSHRREIPARVRAELDRRRSGVADRQDYRPERKSRRTADRNAIARSARGE